MEQESVFNHVGHCVRDMDRSIRFYTDVLGFALERTLQVADTPTDRLLRLEAPLGMSAVYLRRDGLILELMTFEREGNPPVRERVFNEPGLTHLSFSVDDVGASAARAAELGGEVLKDTEIGAAVFVRDPDGQLIELLPMSYRRSLPGGGSS
jgi:catechol 2,3-dioxygenase-like lactoylglutathione lyase family enzyme